MSRSARAHGISGRASHWQRVYRARREDELSWYQKDPARSLRWIQKYAPPPARVVDVGGGSSALAGSLVEAGYRKVTVFDISRHSAVQAARRIGEAASHVRWRTGDITTRRRLETVDLWHDRALFHFLTDPDDRDRYLSLARRTVRPGGHLLLATFAADGPEQCSGLPVARYSPTELAREVGVGFQLVGSARELHTTPWGAVQPFTYAIFLRAGRRVTADSRRATRPARSRGARSRPGLGATTSRPA